MTTSATGAEQPTITSCVVVEAITAAERMADDNTTRTGRVRAELGVDKMWTHADHRRHGYAQRLIDAARCHLYLGECCADLQSPTH